MIFIPNDSHDPARNLAAEEYILTSFGIREDVLFFYVNAPSIIIGRHQNTLDEIDLDYVREKNIKIVRRCSGGGAVYHDLGNLNYSLIRPGDTKAACDFSILLTPILEALHKLGLPAELSGRNDLILNGAKFSGNAYYHNRFGSVTHGTLLWDSDLNILSKALRPKTEKLSSKGIRSVRSRVCCIREELPEIKDISELEAAIVRGFSTAGRLSLLEFTEKDRQEIETLADERYRNDLWTFGESPAFTIRRQIHQPSGWIDFRADVRDETINHARLFGDFFCIGDIRDLEKALEGTRWEKNAVEKSLKDGNWSSYFPELPPEKFTELLFSRKADA